MTLWIGFERYFSKVRGGNSRVCVVKFFLKFLGSKTLIVFPFPIPISLGAINNCYAVFFRYRTMATPSSSPEYPGNYEFMLPSDDEEWESSDDEVRAPVANSTSAGFA